MFTKNLFSQEPFAQKLSAVSRRSFRPGPTGGALLALIGLLHSPAIAFAQAAAAAAPEVTPAAPAAATAATTTATTSATTTGAGAEAESLAKANPSAEVRESARTAYFAGKTAYAAGNFAEAERQFAFANSLISAIQAQYWYALSLHEQGKSTEALAALSLILTHADRGKLRSEQLKDTAARHAQLKSAPAEVLLNSKPSGAKVTVNGQVIAVPTPAPLRLGPGQHEVQVELAGFETQRFLLTAQPGAKISPIINLVPSRTTTAPGLGAGLGASPLAAPLAGSASLGATSSNLSAPAPILPTSADSYERQPQSVVPAIVTLGIAGIGGIVGTVFGLRALKDKKAFKNNPSSEAADDTERNALIADMAFGVTLTLGITGAVLLLTRESQSASASADHHASDQATTNLQILPFATPHSAGAAAFFNF